QADIDRVHVGQAARITLTSYPSVVLAGRVERLSRLGSTTQLSNRVRTFAALVSIERGDPHLMPDLAAPVDLAARDDPPAAFGRRCIPAPTPPRWETRVGGPGADCVAPPSNIPDILSRRALSAERLAALGATPEFHHGLLAP